MLADDIGIIDQGELLEEESLKELEQKNGKYFHFTVSDAQAAARILCTQPGVQKPEILTDYELTVPGNELDAGKAVRELVQGGLTVSDAHLCEDTLEDYFKRITGGEGIA